MGAAQIGRLQLPGTRDGPTGPRAAEQTGRRAPTGPSTTSRVGRLRNEREDNGNGVAPPLTLCIFAAAIEPARSPRPEPSLAPPGRPGAGLTRGPFPLKLPPGRRRGRHPSPGNDSLVSAGSARLAAPIARAPLPAGPVDCYRGGAGVARARGWRSCRWADRGSRAARLRGPALIGPTRSGHLAVGVLGTRGAGAQLVAVNFARRASGPP